MRFGLFFILFLFFIGRGVRASEEVAQSFTLDGRLYADAAATTPLLDAVSLKVQILNPAESCILYEETQSTNTTASNGYYTVHVGLKQGAGLRTSGDTNNPLSTVFSNAAGAITGKLVADGVTPCSYTPAVGHTRAMKVTVTPSDNIPRTTVTNMVLDSVPTALVAERAESLRGLSPSSFLQVNSVGSQVLTQTNLESVFTATNFTNLTNLLAVPAANIVQTGANGTARLPIVAGDPASGQATGQVWYDSVTNKLKYYNGTSAQVVGGGTGTVTSVGSGTGLTGGPITGSGTLAVDVGTAAGQIVQVQTGGKLPALDGSNLTNLSSSGVAAGGGFVKDGNSFTAAATLGTNDAYALNFETNNTTRMTIDSTGKVGIGTTSPLAEFEVVNGNVGLRSGTIAPSIQIWAQSANALPGQLSFLASRSNATARPQTNDILGQITFSPVSDQSAAIKAVATENHSGGISSGASLAFETTANTTVASQERMRIDHNGNIGIGTTTPNATVEIVKNQTTPTQLQITNTSAGGASNAELRVYTDTETSGFAVGSYGSGFSIPSFIAGKSGMFANTTPIFFAAPASTNFTFNTIAGAELVRINGDGKVGIGTTAPVAKLQVGSAPTATANYPLFAMGTAAFDGSTAGFFTGNANGTFVGVNAVTGYAGDFANFQVNGVSKYKVDSTGNVTTAGTTSSTGNISTSGNLSTTVTGTITSAGTITAGSGAASTSPTTGSLIVTGGAGVSGALNVGTNITANGNIVAAAGTAATAVANQNSSTIYLSANYWDGAATAVDQWGIQNVLGTGTNPSSTLTFGHTGSTGSRYYAFLSGNVGIGTSVPVAPLNIVSSSNIITETQNTTATGANVFQMKNDAGKMLRLFMQGSTNAYNPNSAIVASNAANKLMLLTNEDVSTGGTAPLQVITGGWNNAPAITVTAGNPGAVGIGTTTPGSPLDVIAAYQPLASTNGIAAISSSDAMAIDKGGTVSFGGKYDGSSSYKTFGMIGGFKENGTSGNEAGYLAFATRVDGSLPAERMRLTSTGYLGVGTKAPGYPLVVEGASGSYRTGIQVDTAANSYGPTLTGYTSRDGVNRLFYSGNLIARDDQYLIFGTSANFYQTYDTNAGAFVFGDGTNPFISIYDQGTKGDILFNGGAVKIANNGYVGIGTVAPANPLHVATTIAFDGTNPNVATFSNSVEDTVVAFSAPNAKGTYQIFRNGSDNRWITGKSYFNDDFMVERWVGSNSNAGRAFTVRNSNGYVGIGTDAPQSTLQIGPSGAFPALFGTHSTGANNWMGAFLGMNLGWDGSNWTTLTDSVSSGGAMVSSDAAGNMRFYTYPSGGGSNQTITDATIENYRRVTVTNAGDVGIGTGSPQTKLEVVDGTLGIRSATQNPKIQIWGQGSTNIFPVVALTRSGTNGTTFPQQNDILGDITYNGHTGATSASVIAVAAENQTLTKAGAFLAFRTAPIGSNNVLERMRIADDGKVGIANTLPNYTLDVTGDINATGCLRSSVGIASGACASDARIKTDVHNFDLGLEALLGIQPKYLKYNGLGGHPASVQPELGVIAQDVEVTAPSLVTKTRVKLHSSDTEKTEIKQVNYTAFTYVLINSVKELYSKWFDDSHQIHRELASKEEQIQQLQKENQEMKLRLERLEKAFNTK